jgi:hypothetical protein
MDALSVCRDKLKRTIEKYPTVDKVLVELEKKTNVNKVYIAHGGYTIVGAPFLRHAPVQHVTPKHLNSQIFFFSIRP